MVILGPSVLITQYKTVSCPAPHATHLSQVALDLWATFVTIFGLLLTVLLFFMNLGSQNCPREMASKKGSWICRPRSSQKSEGFPTILFLHRSVKSLSRLLWISQVGALTKLVQPVLAWSECCSMVMTTVQTVHFFWKTETKNQHGGSKNELGKERAREKTTILWVLHFILHFD